MILEGSSFVCFIYFVIVNLAMLFVHFFFNMIERMLSLKRFSQEGMSVLLSCFSFYLLIYLWLCCVFVSVQGLSLVVASGGHSSSRCAGLSLSPPLLLRSTGSRRAGSVVVAHEPSCSAACGIFPDQGSNPCVPCIDRRILNHCATREALFVHFLKKSRGRTACPGFLTWFMLISGVSFLSSPQVYIISQSDCDFKELSIWSDLTRQISAACCTFNSLSVYLLPGKMNPQFSKS